MNLSVLDQRYSTYTSGVPARESKRYQALGVYIGEVHPAATLILTGTALHEKRRLALHE